MVAVTPSTRKAPERVTSLSPIVPVHDPGDRGVLEALASWYCGPAALASAEAAAGEPVEESRPEEAVVPEAPEEPQETSAPAVARPRPATRRLRRRRAKGAPQSGGADTGPHPGRASERVGTGGIGRVGGDGFNEVMASLLGSVEGGTRAAPDGRRPGLPGSVDGAYTRRAA